MSLLSPSITTSSNGSSFTINSFTQNLASVLSDPHRSKNEVAAFFTRHWGEQFMPRQIVSPALTIPAISLEHFRHYLATTAKKHRQYIRARRALSRRADSQQQQQLAQEEVTRDEIPEIFFWPSFSQRDRITFEAVFLEPKTGERDQLLSEADRRRSPTAGKALGRHESCGSLTSMLSVQPPQSPVPVDACQGRHFRVCQRLQQRLEYYDDTIGLLLNQQLEAKNEQFWRTFHTYEALHSDLETTIARVRLARDRLAKANAQLCRRSEQILSLHFAHQNRQKLLARLQEIECLRDAQSTVQMLLNQSDIPRALECIDTAKEVLASELRGVNCFRHLDSQLDELINAIGKMLREEFISIVQREFAWPIGDEPSGNGKGEGDRPPPEEEEELYPVVNSLLHCSEFRFIPILRDQIMEAVKNTTRQMVRGQLLGFLDTATTHGFNPNKLAEQIAQLTDEQWSQTLRAVLHSLLIFCRRVLKIQSLIINCVSHVPVRTWQNHSNLSRNQQSLSKLSSASTDRLIESKIIEEGGGIRRRRPSIETTKSAPQGVLSMEGRRELASIDRDTKSECAEWKRMEEGESGEEQEEKSEMEIVTSNRSDTPSQQEGREDRSGQSKSPLGLSMPCHDISQLRAVVPQLINYAIAMSEERLAKLVSTRFKDLVLKSCTCAIFYDTCQTLSSFVMDCQQIMAEGALEQQKQQNGQQRSPILTTIQQLTGKFVSKFVEWRRLELNTTIDSEPWRPARIPSSIQRMVDQLLSLNKENFSESICETQQQKGEKEEEYVRVGEENFVVVGTALILVRILVQYEDVLVRFPNSAPDLAMDVVHCLKSFNSRTCQLILGAGARQLVGLKTINVKHLALASRSLQFVLKFITPIRQSFAKQLAADRQHFLRHFDQTARDYADHIGEIRDKLLVMMDRELITALEEWKLEGKAPTAQFQQIVMQIGKFYSSYSSVMPSELTTQMLHQIHANFKLYLRQHLQAKGINPHDSITYGMAGHDFAYYVENVRALPDCISFPDDSIGDVLMQKRG